MTTGTDDLRISRLSPLLPPAILIEEQPVTEAMRRTVTAARQAASDVISGSDSRLLAVVGPCSIHDPEAALEYADRLAPLAKRYEDELVLIMRVYFEKPRTTVGWKGLINDPDLDGSFHINKGLRLARSLLCELNARGVPAATEFLDTITPQFLADLVSWGAIGARTTESQVHRELASGLSMPVGFKNATDGSVQVAVDAVRAAQHPHHFLSVTKQGLSAIVSTTGNDRGHVILRGGTRGPNFDAPSIAEAVGALSRSGLPAHLMVDCSHGNSGKKAAQQAAVVDSLAAQLEVGSQAVMGVMIESHLLGGRQDHEAGRPLVRGQSITDECLGWAETEPLLERLAKATRARRSLLAAASRQRAG